LHFSDYFSIFYSFRLYIALLGKVWSAENFQLTCSEDNRYCTFNNVFTNLDKNCDESMSFGSVRHLNFKNSSFESFPAPVCLPKYFFNLRSLQASDCGMSELGETFMKNSTKNQLRDLTKVDFSQNRLSKIEPLDGLPDLRHLNLSSNRIGSLENGSFNGLEQLRVLDLGSNNISKVDPETFSKMNHLERVALAHNKLTELPENLFSSQTWLVEIDLAHNHLTTFNLGTVSFTTGFVRINLAHNNMQSLRNLLSTSFIHQNKTINVTDNKWNCMYAQILEEIASNRKFELIGNIFNCSMSWLGTTNDKLKIQHDNIKTSDVMQMNFENTSVDSRKQFVKQGNEFPPTLDSKKSDALIRRL
jgi:Leucine-rich repeat (LRR) protein